MALPQRLSFRFGGAVHRVVCEDGVDLGQFQALIRGLCGVQDLPAGIRNPSTGETFFLSTIAKYSGLVDNSVVYEIIFDPGEAPPPPPIELLQSIFTAGSNLALTLNASAVEVRSACALAWPLVENCGVVCGARLL